MLVYHPVFEGSDNLLGVVIGVVHNTTLGGLLASAVGDGHLTLRIPGLKVSPILLKLKVMRSNRAP
ncbi:hypothetical protein OK016_16910 [Vibrio chagasii]|nr:hypothetical protein [Vibrio chagasii]